MIPSKKPFQGYGYLLEASYIDLHYRYIQEVPTTTFAGFVSQIGGQFSLFLGISIITCVQFVIRFSYGCYRHLKLRQCCAMEKSHQILGDV
jgi:hypothetical protein